MTQSVIKLTVTAEDRRVAWLASAAVGLSLVDAAIPSPLPGVKPGLANIVTLVVLARAELARAQPAVARVRLEAALVILATADVHPAERATANFTLAQVLDALGGDPPRMRQLAEAARDALRPLGRPYARQLAEVEAFLAARLAP